MKSTDAKLEPKNRGEGLMRNQDETIHDQNRGATPWKTIIVCGAAYLGIIYLQATGAFESTVNGILAQFMVLISVYLAASYSRAGFIAGLSLNAINLVAVLLAVFVDRKTEAITGLVVNVFTIISISIIGVLTSRAQQEIGARTQIEHRLRRSLGEKDVLLKEVHHRVKNNLQIISSLLNLQSTHITDQKTREVLRESQHRVHSMALIHEKLYQSTDLVQIDFASYLKGLVNYLAQSNRLDSSKVTINTVAPNIYLDIATAIPCGLIVNELVSNSLKHAFPANSTGQVDITIEETAKDEYRLVVGDDGVGLPAGLDPAQSTSLGLKLVTSLVEQLNGTLVVKNSPGARFEVRFRK